MNILNTFIERKNEWLISLLQHLQISLVSLIISIFIAVPLGIIFFKSKKIKEFLLQITGIFQTIPSLALLGIFIPIMGIGKLPAIISLTIYGIFPILQGTITGLSEIDPSLEEAARAFGMNPLEKLKKYQLELAMPVLMSGIRTSGIMIIGTATLAALVGAGGLGSFILLGIDRNNPSLILIGAFSSAILAILFSFLINTIKGKKIKAIIICLLAVSTLLAFSFIPFNKSSNQKLVIAGKLGSEPEIIINMYKILIEDATDINVEIKPNFGKTTFLYEALKTGSIDIYPEYSGTIITSLLKDKEKTFSNDPKIVYEMAKEKILKQDNLIYLKPSTFQNTYALAVKEKYAKENMLENISDLKKIEKNIIAGFTLEFNDRKDGNIGLKEIYKLNLKVKTMEPSLRYQAISNDNVQLVDVYSTDSKILTNKLKLLKDDKNLFPPYQVAPLIRKETIEKHPELKEILEKLSDKITTEEMIKMNYEVDIMEKPAYDVAKEFLISAGLIK